MNVLQEVAHGLKLAGEDVVKGVEAVISLGGKVIKVVEDAETLTPAFKQALAMFVNDAQPIASALAPIIATQGTNVAVDVAAITPLTSDILKLAKDF
jgi:hypothetical protein